MVGVTRGTRRCWSQKSTDHRGDPSFPGLVCTLLKDEEYWSIVKDHGGDVPEDLSIEAHQGVTSGLVYSIPKELVRECLDELDFREKGGYARDVIDVDVDFDDEGGRKKTTIQAMLYRGTPDNPAFSTRALLDEVHAAAIISAAIGPSGKNDAYLYELNDFLLQCSGTELGEEISGIETAMDDQTSRLASLSKFMQKHRLYFLYGTGSNQYDQLLLRSSISKNEINSARLVNRDEAHDLKETLLIVPKGKNKDENGGRIGNEHETKQVFAGGAHSGLLTHGGHFYLWGCNDDQQLGRDKETNGRFDHIHPVIPPMDIKVETAALGHTHTLIIEKETKALYAFGYDNRGQVSASIKDANKSEKLTRLDLGQFEEVAAGLFHSAAITTEGELVTFGCDKFGQSLPTIEKNGVGRWKPEDGSRLVKVACGRRHTLCLDEHGRVWSMGDNKYGQLGRKDVLKRDQKMKLVDGFLGQKGSGCVHIDCGWSHTIAMVEKDDTRVDGYSLYVWGRNDKKQIAFQSHSEPIVRSPCPVDHALNAGLQGAACGSESISVLDIHGNLMSCGWNEHGNLGIGNATDVSEFTKMTGADILSQNKNLSGNNGKILMAYGGAHFVATRILSGMP
jgi:alpha-tubulin suppressor-like RCC1 family protein/cation transport regulator ChaC